MGLVMRCMLALAEIIFGIAGLFLVETYLWDGKYVIGQSAVGQKTVDHLPDSLKWKIQLWTIEDCIKFCNDTLPPLGRYTFEFVELYMIKKLSPILNVYYNLSPGSDTTPKSKKEIERKNYLDKMYREIFDKKR